MVKPGNGMTAESGVKPAPCFKHNRPKLQAAYEPPGSEAEKITAEIWQELLGIDTIGVNDDFFEMGGHSLLAARLASRLREIFRIDIPLNIFLNKPTVRQLMEYIADRWGSKESVEEIAATYREAARLAREMK
jgi:acyl carrier protein